MNRQPHRCPVCGGNGIVPNSFYNTVSGMGYTISTAPEQCRSCNGTGIVWSGDFEINLKIEDDKDELTSSRESMSDSKTITLYRGLKANPLEQDIQESNGWCYGGITNPNHHPEGKVQIVSSEDYEDHSKLVFIDVKPETVGQFTGHHNGIFNNDIVEMQVLDKGTRRGIVKWDDKNMRFYVDVECCPFGIKRDKLSYSYKPVGTIHDTPSKPIES
jgi:hypothetical protein